MASLKPPLPLDPSIYNLKEDEIVFFKAQTGIHDDDELRKHIMEVQAEAYAVHPYPCIRRFAFTTFKISRYPGYQAILKLGKERSDAILLDLGCCFGNDARKAIADGFPRENVIMSDIRPEYWTLGHKLFKTSQETFPITFLQGDIFDPSFFSPTGSPAPTSCTLPLSAAPSLSMLTSLTPLQHYIFVIHASAFFHLFPAPQQRTLAHLLGTLLSPLPGSMILGSHIGRPDAEEDKDGDMALIGPGTTSSKYSPTSWENLWVGEGGVFKPEDVVLWTISTQVERKYIVQAGRDSTHIAHLLVWSVTRA